MTFDPDSYWRSMGEWLAGPGAATSQHKESERLLAEVLRDLGPIDSVVDLGCGRGRIASLLEKVLPEAAYTGVDIGEAQIEATQKIRPDGDFYTARLQDFDPDRKWDLVIISEVLMHIPPSDIQAVCTKVKTLADKWIVTIDWTQPLSGKIAEWNWLFDYPALFGPESVMQAIPTGKQTIFVIRP